MTAGSYKQFSAHLAKTRQDLEQWGEAPGLSQTLHDVEGLSDDQARAACRHLWDDPIQIVALGGEGRDVWRVRFADQISLVLMFRKNDQRAVLERNVLLHLSKHGIPVPRIHTAKGHWLLTEDLGDQRLPMLLSQLAFDDQKRLLERALVSLLALQTCGHQIGLSRKVAPIGASANWLANLFDAPSKLAELADVPSPAPLLDRDALQDLLTCKERHFIKWDARLGNAMARKNDRVRWFDFEHCGSRDPLDDLAWFFGDETLDNALVQDNWIFEDILPHFCKHRPLSEGQRYLRVMGVLHMCIRLSVLLGRKQDCAMVTKEAFESLCARAALWAEQDELTRPLAFWLKEAPDSIQTEKKAQIGPVTIHFR
ncbi:MAG: aminoglycoside phosphotransferase family protein [Cohaesibacter sp.]|nr:aminoglycoside phosphotransferase family protein [Cohaesibacter sp.]